MSKEKLSKILSMIADREKRQHLLDFKIVAFCTSKQVEQVINRDDEYFYQTLSKIDVENGYAEVAFKNLILYVTVIEMSGIEQGTECSEDIIIFHIVSLDEELERQLEQKDISQFLDSGVIDIE
jgi:hypothetical protein